VQPARGRVASPSVWPSSREAASSYLPCLTRRSANRTRAPDLSVRLPSAHSRATSVSRSYPRCALIALVSEANNRAGPSSLSGSSDLVAVGGF